MWTVPRAGAIRPGVTQLDEIRYYQSIMHAVLPGLLGPATHDEEMQALADRRAVLRANRIAAMAVVTYRGERDYLIARANEVKP
jgi:hypothetical protein